MKNPELARQSKERWIVLHTHTPERWKREMHRRNRTRCVRQKGKRKRTGQAFK